MKLRISGVLLFYGVMAQSMALAGITIAGETPLIITGVTAGNVVGIFTDAYHPEQVLDSLPSNKHYADTSDSFEASTIPNDYRKNCTSIQTKWAERGSTGTSLISFTTNVSAQITVWHVDSVVGGRPTWITNNFADSDTDLQILGETASGFSSVEDAGVITLGGNTAGGDATKPMYAVSICPAWLQAPAAIVANDGKYEFVTASIQVSESTTPTVGASTRVDGTDSAVSVDVFDTTNGTCTGSGADYDAISPQTISWADAVGGIKAGFTITVNAVSATCTIILGFETAVGGITASSGFQIQTVTVNDIPAPSTGTIFICFDATACNAGAGSGWVTGSPSNSGDSKAEALSCPKDASSYNTLARTHLPVAGDVIVMGDGTYTYDNCGNLFSNRMLNLKTQHGTADDPIVWKAENAGMVIWDGEETDNDAGKRENPNALNGSGSRLYLLTMKDCSFITIQDFELKNGSGGIYGNTAQDPCHDIIIDNMELHNFGISSIHWQVDYYNLTVRNSLLYDVVDDISRYETPPTGDAADDNHACVHNHNMYLNGYNILLENNIVHSSDGGSMLTLGGACNFDAEGEPPLFTHLIHAYNNTFNGNGCVVTYQETGGGNIDRYNSIDFWNRTRGGSFCTPVGGDPRNFKNVEFRNNLFLGGQTKTWTTEDSQFISNTNVETVQLPDGTHCTHWPWGNNCSTADGDNGYLRINNNTSETRALNSSHQAEDVDEYLNNNDDCTSCAVKVVSLHDPEPLNGSQTDICGQGDTNFAPALDFNGTARGNPPDIGAIECP